MDNFGHPHLSRGTSSHFLESPLVAWQPHNNDKSPGLSLKSLPIYSVLYLLSAILFECLNSECVNVSSKVFPQRKSMVPIVNYILITIPQYKVLRCIDVEITIL